MNNTTLPEQETRIIKWVVMGLYYGYSESSIMNFVQRCNQIDTQGDPCDPEEYKTSWFNLSSTGYIPAEVELKQNHEEVIAGINSRRYCKLPFNHPDIDNYNSIDELNSLASNLEFCKKVNSILEQILLADWFLPG